MTTEATENKTCKDKCLNLYKHGASFFRLQEPVGKLVSLVTIIGSLIGMTASFILAVTRTPIYLEGCNAGLASWLNHTVIENPDECNSLKSALVPTVSIVETFLMFAILPGLFVSAYHFARLMSFKCDGKKFLAIATAFFSMATFLAFHLAAPIVALLHLSPENDYKCGFAEGYSLTQDFPGAHCAKGSPSLRFGTSMTICALAFCDVMIGAITGIVMRCVNKDGERQYLIPKADDDLNNMM